MRKSILLVVLSLLIAACTSTSSGSKRQPRNRPIRSTLDTTSRTTVITPSSSKPNTNKEVSNEEKSSGPITLTIQKQIDLPRILSFKSYSFNGVVHNDLVHTFEFNDDLSEFTLNIFNRNTNITSSSTYRKIPPWDGSMKDGINIVNTKVAQSNETPIDFVIFMVDGNSVSHIKLGSNTFYIREPIPPKSVTPTASSNSNTTQSHKVVYGENAKRIANKYYKSLPEDQRVLELIKMNPKLKDRKDTKLFPNETLIIRWQQ